MTSFDEKQVDELIVVHGKRADIGVHMQEILAKFDARQPLMAKHVRCVALYAYLAAIELGLNPMGALFMALGHDVGKLMLPDDLFSGRNINKGEYETIKKHSWLGYKYWKDQHIMCAIAAGAHHAMYEGGYGIDLVREAPEWVQCSQNLLDLVVLISMVDFIEAYLHRKTQQFGPVIELPLERRLQIRHPYWKIDRIKAVLQVIEKIA